MGTVRGTSSDRLAMRSLSVITFLLGLAQVIRPDPEVFEDYFDDGMKLVDISQDSALRSCLADGKTADETKAAYDKCYGKDYNFDDLATASDGEGLPDEFEGKEGCFYKEMGWVSEENKLDEVKIAADMAGLEKEIQAEFSENVATCVGWSGNFGERRKRSVGEAETVGAVGAVPSVMDSGRRAMGWVKNLVRKVRSPGNGEGGKVGGKKGKKDKATSKRKNNKGKKEKATRKRKNNKGKKDKATRKRNNNKGKKDKATRKRNNNKGKKEKATRKRKNNKGKKDKVTRKRKNNKGKERQSNKKEGEQQR